LTGEHKRVRGKVAHEEGGLLRLRHELHPLLEQGVEHVAQPFLAVDDLDDVVDRAELFGLRAHLGFALADFPGAIGNHPFEATPLGPQGPRF
jgi:hypothetical protein